MASATIEEEDEEADPAPNKDEPAADRTGGEKVTPLFKVSVVAPAVVDDPLFFTPPPKDEDTGTPAAAASIDRNTMSASFPNPPAGSAGKLVFGTVIVR